MHTLLKSEPLESRLLCASDLEFEGSIGGRWFGRAIEVSGNSAQTLLPTLSPGIWDETTWPDNWTKNEIEAKWTTTEPVIAELRAWLSLPDVLDAFESIGIQLSPRWKSQPRLFIDTYYDTPAKELAAADHVLRHRRQYEWRGSSEFVESELSADQLLNLENWKRQWDRVQYKRSPTIREAVWFREEVGDEKLSRREVRDALSGVSVSDFADGDNPIDTLSEDHPDVKWFGESGGLEVSHIVRDLRYRIEFISIAEGRPILEFSLDHLITDSVVDNEESPAEVWSYEVELEVLSDEEADVKLLFEWARWFEACQSLMVRSTTSKGLEFLSQSPTPAAAASEVSAAPAKRVFDFQGSFDAPYENIPSFRRKSLVDVSTVDEVFAENASTSGWLTSLTPRRVALEQRWRRN